MQDNALAKIRDLVAGRSGGRFAFPIYRRPDGRAWGRFNSAGFALQGIAPGSIVGTFPQIRQAGRRVAKGSKAFSAFRFDCGLFDRYGNEPDPNRVLAAPVGTFTAGRRFIRFNVFAVADVRDTNIGPMQIVDVPPISLPPYARVKAYIEAFRPE